MIPVQAAFLFSYVLTRVLGNIVKIIRNTLGRLYVIPKAIDIGTVRISATVRFARKWLETETDIIINNIPPDEAQSRREKGKADYALAIDEVHDAWRKHSKKMKTD